MSRTRLGLFDPETEYVQKLGAYIMLNERETLEAHLYTEEEKLMINLDSLDVVLVPEDYLSTDDPRFVRMVEKKDYLSDKQVLKYQKAQSLISDVKNLFSIHDVRVDKRRCKVICVLSPSRHELQMLYSMCLCKELSVNQRVLYINLCSNSGFASLFHDSEEKNLEDLFCDIDSEGFSLDSYVRKDQGVSFIAPSKRPEMLWEVDENLFSGFLTALENSSYEVVIIDLESYFPEYFRLLKECEEIIVLGKEGFLSEYCKKEYLENLSLHLGEACLGKIKEVVLPLNSVGIWESQFLLDDLFRGNLGDYVRKGLDNNERSG